MATLFCPYDRLRSVSSTGFKPPVSVDLSSTCYRVLSSVRIIVYPTTKIASSYIIFILLCAKESAWVFPLKIDFHSRLCRRVDMSVSTRKSSPSNRIRLEIFIVWKCLPGEAFRKLSSAQFTYRPSIGHIIKKPQITD